MRTRIKEPGALDLLRRVDPGFLRLQLREVMGLVDETPAGDQVRLSLLTGLEEFLSALLAKFPDAPDLGCPVCKGRGWLVNGAAVIRCERCLAYEGHEAARKAVEQHTPEGYEGGAAAFAREIARRGKRRR